MIQAGKIQIAAYAFKRSEDDYWPAIAIFSIDDQGKEKQLFYAQPGFGGGLRQVRFKTETEALQEAKLISAAHFDNGILKVVYRGQVYPADLL